MSTIPTSALYVNTQDHVTQVQAYKVSAGLEFAPGPDLRHNDDGTYWVLTAGGLTPVAAGDWVAGASKVGTTYADAAFIFVFAPVVVVPDPLPDPLPDPPPDPPPGGGK